MISPLQAVREELASLRPRVGALEQAEALLASAYEVLGPPEVEAPRSVAAGITRASRAPSGGRATREQIRDYVVTCGPVGRGDILAALGGDPKSVDNRLRSLFVKGEIEADGRRGARRYRAPSTTAQSRVGGTGRKAGQTSSSVPERGVYPVYDAIGDLGGATTEQLAVATGQPKTHVVEQGRRLVQLGLVRFAGVGGKRMWLAADAAAGA
jgi:hypothetical protein